MWWPVWEAQGKEELYPKQSTMSQQDVSTGKKPGRLRFSPTLPPEIN